MSRGIHYADKYVDLQYEYRHVILPKEMAKGLPKQRLLGEDEWRGIGVQQSLGWQHYMIHQSRSWAETSSHVCDEDKYFLVSCGVEPVPTYDEIVGKHVNLVYRVRPEPHVLCFRRPHGTIPETGEVDPMREREDKMRAAAELGIDLGR